MLTHVSGDLATRVWPALPLPRLWWSKTLVTGTVGSAVRKEYTIISDVVNVASRLDQMNKELGTRALATRSVVGQLRSGTAQTTPIGSVMVRGREHPIDIFEVA
jgi:adenylate cyclase